MESSIMVSSWMDIRFQIARHATVQVVETHQNLSLDLLLRYRLTLIN